MLTGLVVLYFVGYGLGLDECIQAQLPQQKQYNLTHYQQRYNWDCGLSCVIMVLNSAQRKEFLNNFAQICQEEGFGSSVWTIDLCYLLKRFRIRHEYYTKTLGIDPNYSEHHYYTNIIDKDEQRVTRKFKDAQACGLYVQKRTLRMVAILRHLADNGPVILLTNASLLSCEICEKAALQKFSCFPPLLVRNTRAPKSFAGHYVILCGYDLKKKEIYYRNPEVHDGLWIAITYSK